MRKSLVFSLRKNLDLGDLAIFNSDLVSIQGGGYSINHPRILYIDFCYAGSNGGGVHVGYSLKVGGVYPPLPLTGAKPEPHPSKIYPLYRQPHPDFQKYDNPTDISTIGERPKPPSPLV